MTQGTIFSGAVAADYIEGAAHGLIITARCDIAHDKTRIYNYVPIVTLDEWLHQDGRIILAERLKAEAKNGMRNVLRQAKFSVNVLETESPHSVGEALFPADSSSKLRDQFWAACNRYELAQKCIESSPSERLCLKLVEGAEKQRDLLLAELVNNRLGGFYFLHGLEHGGSDLGYVALIREIHTMPRELAHAVSKGIDKTLYESMCMAQSAFYGKLLIADDEFAYPVGQLLSPYLEHLLQTFSFLFGRIGLPDPETSYIDKLWSRQPTVIGKPEISI